MKKNIAANVIFGMLITCTIVTFAISDSVAKQDQTQPVTRKQATIRGHNDKRVITPYMNYYERVMIQRDIKKRAAAKRNQLIRQAQREREHQAQPAPTGYPTIQ